MQRDELLTVYGRDPKAMATDILTAAKVADMIPGPKARILLKPNLVTASPAAGGATTHPELLAAAIEYLRAHGFDNLAIVEGSWVGERTARAFEACGYTQLARRYGVELIDAQRDKSRRCDCAGMPIDICESALAADFLINFPVMKGHCQTGVTCALKNLKGLIPNAEKRRFHTLGLHRPIAHLAAFLRQGFVLVDAICGDLDFEEGGNPVPRGQLIGCLDPVLCDAYVCQLMGYRAEDVGYVAMAEKLGAGCADPAMARVTQLNSPEAAPAPVQPSGRVRALARYAQPADACSACYANLIQALLRLEEEGTPPRDKVCIGQGWRGKQGALGVGNCTAGCARHLPGCPPKASEMVAFLKNL